LIGGFNLAATGTDVLSLRELEIYGSESLAANGFAKTTIEYLAGQKAVKLTWASRPGLRYVAKYSPGLQNWEADLADGLSVTDDENPDDGDHISVTFPLEPAGLAGFDTLYFRIELEE
jgi:hypothetical protein